MKKLTLFFLMFLLCVVFSDLKANVPIQPSDVNELNAGLPPFETLGKDVYDQALDLISKNTSTCIKDFLAELGEFNGGTEDDHIKMKEIFKQIKSKLEATKGKVPGDKPVDKGFHRSITDKAFYTYANSKEYKTFVKQFTGHSELEVTNKKYWKSIYELLQKLEASMKAVTVFDYSTMGVGPMIPGCYQRDYQSKIGASKMTYPFIHWAGYIKFKIQCSCVESTSSTELRQAEVILHFTVKSKIIDHSEKFYIPGTNNTITVTYPFPSFNKATNMKIKSMSISCCSEKKKEDASYIDPSEDISNDENAILDMYIEELFDEMDDELEEDIDFFEHFLGINVGLGFDGENDELSFSGGLSHFHLLPKPKKIKLYVGAEASVDVNTLVGNNGDFTSVDFMVGPKIEAFYPLGKSPVAVKTGIGGGFGVGVDKFSSSKDNNTMGYIDLTAGLYVQMKKLGFCLEAPFFQFQHVKTRRDFGNTTNNLIGFNLNRKMPLKASIAIPLGK